MTMYAILVEWKLMNMILQNAVNAVLNCVIAVRSSVPAVGIVFVKIVWIPMIVNMRRTNPMALKEIIKKHLDDNGYDGLFCPDECACLKEDLAPCCNTFSNISNCRPGYKRVPSEKEQGETGYAFMIGGEKQV